MSDRFQHTVPGVVNPITAGFSITPDNDNDLDVFTRAINVSVSGPVRLATVEDDEITIFVAAGIPFPIRAKRVFATGTDAGDIVGLV